MNVYEVVTKLIGPVEAVGESGEDERRYANLGAMGDLVEALVRDIDRATVPRARPEASMRKIGQKAVQILDSLGIEP